MQAKIALLAKLAFGQDVALDKVPCAGISNLSSADFACAKVIKEKSPMGYEHSPRFSDRLSAVRFSCLTVCRVVQCGWWIGPLFHTPAGYPRKRAECVSRLLSPRGGLLAKLVGDFFCLLGAIPLRLLPPAKRC